MPLVYGQVAVAFAIAATGQHEVVCGHQEVEVRYRVDIGLDGHHDVWARGVDFECVAGVVELCGGDSDGVIDVTVVPHGVIDYTFLGHFLDGKHGYLLI
jgi:hypothetical protein